MKIVNTYYTVNNIKIVQIMNGDKNINQYFAEHDDIGYVLLKAGIYPEMIDAIPESCKYIIIDTASISVVKKFKAHSKVFILNKASKRGSINSLPASIIWLRDYVQPENVEFIPESCKLILLGNDLSSDAIKSINGKKLICVSKFTSASAEIVQSIPKQINSVLILPNTRVETIINLPDNIKEIILTKDIDPIAITNLPKNITSIVIINKSDNNLLQYIPNHILEVFLDNPNIENIDKIPTHINNVYLTHDTDKDKIATIRSILMDKNISLQNYKAHETLKMEDINSLINIQETLYDPMNIKKNKIYRTNQKQEGLNKTPQKRKKAYVRNKSYESLISRHEAIKTTSDVNTHIEPAKPLIFLQPGQTIYDKFGEIQKQTQMLIKLNKPNSSLESNNTQREEEKIENKKVFSSKKQKLINGSKWNS